MPLYAPTPSRRSRGYMLGEGKTPDTAKAKRDYQTRTLFGPHRLPGTSKLGTYQG